MATRIKLINGDTVDVVASLDALMKYCADIAGLLSLAREGDDGNILINPNHIVSAEEYDTDRMPLVEFG
jgi:hypothetical protein